LVREQQAQQALATGMASISETMLPKLLAAATIAHRPEIVGRVREMMLNTNPVGAAAALRGMAQRADQSSFLNRIIAPALILVGEHDAITPLTDAELMHREITGSRLAVIKDAGHVSNMEQPESFNRTLLEFLRELNS